VQRKRGADDFGRCFARLSVVAVSAAATVPTMSAIGPKRTCIRRINLRAYCPLGHLSARSATCEFVLGYCHFFQFGTELTQSAGG
jgi:hypothetical protein